MRKVFFDLPKALVLFTLIFTFLCQLFESFANEYLTFAMFTLLAMYVGGSISFSKNSTTSRIGYALYAYGVLQVFLEAYNSPTPITTLFGFVVLFLGLAALVIMLVVEVAKYFEVKVSVGSKKKKSE